MPAEMPLALLQTNLRGERLRSHGFEWNLEETAKPPQVWRDPFHMITCSSVPRAWEFGGQKLALPDVFKNIAICLWCTLSGLPSLSSQRAHMVWLTHVMPGSSHLMI